MAGPNTVDGKAEDGQAIGGDEAVASQIALPFPEIPPPDIPPHIKEYVTKVCREPLNGPFSGRLRADRRITLEAMIGDDALLYLHFKDLLAEEAATPPAAAPTAAFLPLKSWEEIRPGLSQGIRFNESWIIKDNTIIVSTMI